MLGPVFAIFRPLAAFISGLFCGLVVNAIDNDEHKHSDINKQSKQNIAPIFERQGGDCLWICHPTKRYSCPLVQGLLLLHA